MSIASGISRLGFYLSAVLVSTLGLIFAASASQMAVSGQTSQPIGHYDYCKRYSTDCKPINDRGPAKMNASLWKLINQVNDHANRTVTPASDLEIYGQEEYWEYPRGGAGDCEDYALEKRRLLMLRGISPSNLLITVVRKQDGEGHALLTVRTDKGDYLLDNLEEKVSLWDTSNYHFLKRQASNHAGRWVTIRGGQPVYAVSAVPAKR